MGGYIVRDFEYRRDNLSGRFGALDILNMGAEGLLDLQHALGVGGDWGEWEFPEEYMPDGQLKVMCCRSCSIRQLDIDEDIESLTAAQAWTEIVRYGVVRSLVPGKRVLAKPTTIIAELKLLVRFARRITEKPYDSEKFWSKASVDEFPKNTPTFKSVIDALRRFKDRGYIGDCFLDTPKVEGPEIERDRFNECEYDHQKKGCDSWLPLPDIFTSECGWRSIRVIKIIGPLLLDAIEAALLVPIKARQDGKNLHPRNQQIVSAQARDTVIKNWSWRSKGGASSESLGFDLMIKETKGRNMLPHHSLPFLTWPPKTFADAWSLLSIIQGAHLFTVCLASGARASEVCAFTEDCLIEAPGGGSRILGKTYKLVTDVGGRQRDFNAPQVVVEALQQQIRLAKLIKKRAGVEGDHLWVHARTFGRGRMGEKHLLLSQFIDFYSHKLNLRQLLDGSGRLHIHRFRKTLARIVALSLVNSPLILMDCFGHEDPDMTIRSYILSDKSIAREVLKVQRELVVLMAIDIVQDSENLGGAVGEQLHQRKADYLQLLGKSEFEPKDAYEFAVRETFDGRSWLMVSPGVYCTLPSGAGGPCSKGQGMTNPAYCQGGCPFQLLTASHKQKCDDAIAEIVSNLEKALVNEEHMMVSLWAGQLKNWLCRWPEVEDKWRSHPLVEAYGKLQEK